ncbi:MAG: cardiolipin synthase B [Actinobacteria bacterium]|nr:cardiolipin synthase B [Actinomycetota bacterium]
MTEYGDHASNAIDGDDRTDPGRYRRVLEGLTGIPATDGNQIDILRNGDQIFPAMLDAIREASTSVDLLTYSWWGGQITQTFADALAERARAGVRVRVMIDSLGGRQLDDGMADRMRDAGVLVHFFRPYMTYKIWNLNLRTHRRALVCDQEVAFTGGVGIAQEWVGDARTADEWRDTHYRVRGPAVDGIHAAFLSNWLQTTYPLIDERDRFPERAAAGQTPVQTIRATSEPGWNDLALTMHGMLELAVERVRITSAYFRPPQHFIDLLITLVSRGVTVQVLTPGPHTEPQAARWISQHAYDDLLDGGVELYNYQRSMLHAKIITVDGLVALVGTANFDSRSIALNEQLGLVVHDPSFTATLDEHFDDDLVLSERIDPQRWAQRPQWQRVKERVAHLISYGVRGSGAAH